MNHTIPRLQIQHKTELDEAGSEEEKEHIKTEIESLKDRITRLTQLIIDKQNNE